VAEENEALFKEIDEELRQDKANEMWKAYGNYIIAGALSLVLGVAGFQGWQKYDTQQKMARGEVFENAKVLAADDKISEAIDAFGKVADGNSDGYAQLALFREAGLLAKSGDYSASAAVYGKLSKSDDLDQQYRDLATVLGALQELNLSTGEGTLIDGLPALLESTNPWRHMAREALGASALKNGDKNKSREHFQALADDATAPQGLAQRAGEMLKAIGE
jgi:hypothetical protein